MTYKTEEGARLAAEGKLIDAQWHELRDDWFPGQGDAPEHQQQMKYLRQAFFAGAQSALTLILEDRNNIQRLARETVAFINDYAMHELPVSGNA